MRILGRTGLVIALALAGSASLVGQSTLSWAGPPLFVLDVQGTALDEFPSSVKALLGTMTTVDKNGQRMLRASSPSEFLITLPQNLPAAFTVILDVIPKGCCAPEDIMLEGTPTMNRGVASVQLTWQPAHIMAVGGGGEMYQSDMPEDLAASTPGNPTQLVWEFNGTTIKHYTNGRRLYTLDKQFARGRVLRVWLGGADEGSNAVHLASLAVLAGAVASGVVVQNPGQTPPPGGQTASSSQALIGPTPATVTLAPKVTQGAAGPVVQWTAISGAQGYTVRRWKSDDPTCCNNASAPMQATSPWQDAALVITGTYVYEVTAKLSTGATVADQTQFTVMTLVAPSTPTLSAPSPSTPPPPPSTTPVASAPIAVQSGTPVRTSSAPPPRSGAAAALTPTGPPPNNISVTGTPSLAKLNWSSISGLRGVTYRVDRSLESNPSCCAGQSATLTFPAWTDEGLQWSGAYIFRITAFYPDGTWGVATTRYVRPDPVNPAHFRAELVSAGSVYLRWDAVPNADWYELSGPGLELGNFHATGTAYNVHNLAPGTYTWRIGTFYSSPNAPAPVSGPASAFPSITVTVP